MFQDGEGASLDEKRENQINVTLGINRNKQAVIAVCVALCMLFMRTGLLSFLFLAPLGYAVIVSGSLWFVFIAAASINILISVLMHIFVVNNGNLWLDIFYFTTIFLMFTWIVGGNSRYVINPIKLIFANNFRTAYRFIIASVIGAAAFIIFIMSKRNNIEFNTLIEEMAGLITAMVAPYENESQTLFAPERILEMIKNITLRGGAIISILSVFFLNYQLTIIALKLIAKIRDEQDVGLMRFFTPRDTIWVFLGALFTVILTSRFDFEFVNILAWNALVISAVLFLAQGVGIVFYLLAGRTQMFRFFAGLSILILLISPLNVIAFVGLLVLGIAETWLPIRVKRTAN